MTVTPELLQGIPLFADLDEIELLQVMACFSLQHVAAGEVLYDEGAPATSACFIIAGELEALTALPGGGETQVGVMGPGDMIGEMALIAGGSRMATVRARDQVTAVSVSFAFFQAALNQMSVPAFKILRRIMHDLAARLEGLHNKVFTAWDCDGYRPVRIDADGGLPVGDFGGNQKISFDYRPFLPITPFFEDFEEVEIERILETARVLEISRNEYLYREADAAACCYIIIRGAVDNTIMRDRRYQLSVLGPGRLCGGNALIAQKPQDCDAKTRSDSLVLRLEAEDFATLFNGTGVEALKFQARVSHNQLLDLKSADNLLTTLVSQAHIRDTIPSPA